jgi:hypothetical protein
MTKAEMEAHFMSYNALMEQASAAVQEGLYRDAVQFALQTWEHIDGMMQYARRYEEREFETIESIELILRFAPALLDFKSLDSLEALLKNTRRITKNTTEDLPRRVEEARAVMREAHRMWDHLEQNPGFRQNELRRVLGSEQEQWRKLSEWWERMHLLRRVPEGNSYRLALSTRLGEVVAGKCPACGAISEAPKAMFLEQLCCPDCGKEDWFVILATRQQSKTKG